MASYSPPQPSFTPIQQRSTPAQQTSPTYSQTSPRTDGSDAKRRRITRACDLCKSRKRRCTGDVPCLSCVGSNAKCTYLTSYSRGKTTAPPTSGLQAPSSAGAGASWSSATESVAVGRLGGSGISRGFDVSGTTNGASAAGLGRQNASRSLSPGGEGHAPDGQYLGPSSPYAFLRRAWKRLTPGHVDAAELQSIDRQHVADETRPILRYGDREPTEIPPGVDLPSANKMEDLIDRFFAFASPTYRYLHEPTVREWHAHMRKDAAKRAEREVPACNAATLYLVAAIALSSLVGASGRDEIDGYRKGVIAHRCLEAAEEKLREEEGRPSLESVQARLAHCQYLLCTSRPGEAWYTLGLTVQMMVAIGIHRRGTRGDPVTRECSKRTFWAAYLLDAYLSGMLGRPHLIHDDDIDQDLPAAVDDEQLTSDNSAKKASQKECSITGAIMHARLAIIIKRASREQTSIAKTTDARKVENAVRLAAQLAEWQESLPVILSGAVHPSTLVEYFRRQLTILRVAKAHASMLIHRFAILTDPRQLPGIEMHIDECLNAALACLDIIVEMAAEKHIFAAFWNTHFVTFSALTIVYIWLIQHRIGRLPPSDAVLDIQDLAKQAEIVRQHLQKATADSAPSLRYTIILEELSHESQRCMDRAPAERTQEESHSESSRRDPSSSLLAGIDEDKAPNASLPTQMEFDASFEFPIDSDLWMQLDSFPFSHTDFGDL